MTDSAIHPDIPDGRVVVRWMQLAFVLLLGIGAGAGLLATLVLVPAWAGSPESALQWTGAINEARFFAVIHPITALLAVGTLAGSSRAAPGSGPWMQVASITFLVLFAITLYYFVPREGLLHGARAAELSPEELRSALAQWKSLNWLRQLLALVSFGAAAHALGLAYRSGPDMAEAPPEAS